MKKNGFTLAEALIALGVVGVVAALMLPMANKFKPDQHKVAYIKTYDALVEITTTAASNRKIYPVMNSNEEREEYKNVVYQDYPLYNTIGIKNAFSGVDLTQGEQKFCEVLAYSFGAEKNNIKCSINNLSGNNYSFKAKSGAEFIVKTTVKEPTSGKGDFKSEVLLDLDGLNKGKNALYSDDNKNPDQFKFMVYANGRVAPLDEKGQSYLSTRQNWKNTDDNMDNLVVLGEDPASQKFEILAYVEPEYQETPQEPPNEEPPNEPATKLGTLSIQDFLNSWIAGQPSYGDVRAYANKYIIEFDQASNGKMNQSDAKKACEAKGMVLPSYFDLSAIAMHASELGLPSGNYWGNPGTDGKARVCSFPGGNCGTNSSSNRFEVLCINKSLR